MVLYSCLRFKGAISLILKAEKDLNVDFLTLSLLDNAVS